MNKLFSTLGRMLTATVLAVVTLLGTVDFASAQPTPPILPQLRLIADQPTVLGNETFYPDARIWVPRSLAGTNREILIPVLVKNGWVSTDIVDVEPLRSFSFKLQYDGSALQAIGVQFLGPQPDDTFSLANRFQIEWEDMSDFSYKTTLDKDNPGDPNGRRIKISGTSIEGLPPSPSLLPFPDPDQREFVELLYIRFKVKALPNSVSDKSPLIITNDTLWWNDRKPTERQFPNLPNEGDPGPFGGLSGLNNDLREPYNLIEPTVPGVAYIQITEIPRLGFAPSIGANAAVRSVPGTNDAEWELIQFMTIDSASYLKGGPNDVRRQIDVLNTVELTRITDITVESDQQWLTFRTVGAKNPISGATRKGEIDYIDNDILGRPNPMGEATDPDPRLVLEIICDPRALENGQEPYSPAGRYEGYITFSSKTMEVSPVRLKVVFIIYRNPVEPNVETDVTMQDQVGTGIRLNVENSAANPQRTSLIFGTGVRATTGIDQLFGEDQYAIQLGGFGARWFPRDENGNLVTTTGMSDLTKRSASRDIRDAFGEETITYYCRFNAGGEENFPVILSWNVNDFPDGSDLFLRDAINGTIFSTDMRNATRLDDQGNFSFTIEDARITEFIIEYRPSNVVRFPVIEKGWNLISLPVRPSDANYKSVYPNSLDIPRFFSANTYVQEENLRFGVGYFVKYGNLLDEIIAGIRVLEIGGNTNFRVRVAGGWNTIGALSVPVGADQISFDPIPGATELPVRQGGVYRYNTGRGYGEVSILEPGIGHWLKVTDAEGYLHLSAMKTGINQRLYDREAILENSNRIAIRDAAQREGTTYFATRNLGIDAQSFELPPVPPFGSFDVRFSSGSYVEQGNAVLEVRGADYPLSINVENPDADIAVKNALTGEVLGYLTRGENGSVVINDKSIGYIQFETKENTAADFAVEQNFPNPFAGQSTIRFSIPETRIVTVTLYNALGQEVRTIASNFFGAGTHTLTVDASGLESGTYVYKMTAGDFSATRQMVIVK